MKYEVINILDLLELSGEDVVKDILSGYSCKQNKEVEYFLHNNAIEFARRKMSITYLVFDEKGDLVAYFTLTHKPSIVREEVLSGTGKKKLSMHARFDESIQAFTVSAFLIAQFGKNDRDDGKKLIQGVRLMDLALGVLKDVQRKVGGGVVFLECEEKAKLLNFYQNEKNNFKVYGERYSVNEQTKYVQLLRFF